MESLRKMRKRALQEEFYDTRSTSNLYLDNILKRYLRYKNIDNEDESGRAFTIEEYKEKLAKANISTNLKRFFFHRHESLLKEHYRKRLTPLQYARHQQIQNEMIEVYTKELKPFLLFNPDKLFQ